MKNPIHSLIFLCITFTSFLPAFSQKIPSPEEIIGFQMGADYKIADYTQITNYLKLLDEKSERVMMEQIGTSVLGKPMYLMFISSEENLKNLNRWKEISTKMARARISEEEAQQLAEEGKAIVWIDGGIHSTEKAATQFPPELAYKVATEETSEMKKIRENVIFLLMPNINPDGLDIVADWYKKNLDNPYETTNPPVLYHYYVGHDDNRDWFMNTQPETRAVTNILFREWYPQIVHNQHQSSPRWTRIFIPPFSKPVNPHIHPGVVHGVNMVGNEMASRFARENKPGVVSDVTFTMWWNGGLRTAPYFHNQIGILTETAHTTPTPRFYPPDSLPKTVGNGIPTDGTAINYPDPWKGGASHFRGAVEYMLTAAMATLSIGADRKDKWLYDMYKMGRDAIEKEDDTFAYIVPAEQWDSGEAHNLVNILMQGGVEVHQATRDFAAENKSYKKGDFILYGGQAFRPYVKDLMEKQEYPDQRLYPGGPPKTPYDLAGWTLPMQMGVEVAKVKDAFDAKTQLLQDFAKPATGKVTSASFGYALSHRENSSTLAVNKLLAEGEKVHWLSEASGNMESGTIIVEKQSNTEQFIKGLAEELGLNFEAVNAKPEVSLYTLQQPKVGLYKSWDANMDEGWTRWLLDQYAFVYDTLHDQDVREADLSQYHAIIIPDQSPQAILHGHSPHTMPDEYTGGMGLAGTLALQNYIEQGGTLITFDEASDFAIQQFGLPVKNVTSSLASKDFFIPGSLIKAIVKTEHPLAYGMQDTVAASFSHSRAFEIVRQSREGEGGKEDIEKAPEPSVETLVSYAKDDLLMSGWALGEKKAIGGKAAALRVQHGEGTVVLFGFRPQFRGQPRATYKLVFNAIYSGTIDSMPTVQVEPAVSESE
ncbi:M14 family metallopeptidase [Catalinimonas niigatensis]|uniref:M14 family metallopeptidase n=1 Tax=Catalinimonas niigatensis TaxID=1397264 RepID=UPI002665F861|nr:M14 metallopeptidase family protein [Catalinimonas niigatensis]WPP49271.1 M14 family metallopeptidase [Catalinimonas niigatensis]